MSNSSRAKTPSLPEEQHLLSERNRNGINILSNSVSYPDSKSERKIHEPVKLTPAWEETNLPNDELNFKGVTMEQANLETNPPKDRLNIVYLILLLHGIGTLLPWNMFINAKGYFVDYKLGANYTSGDSTYANNFMSYLSFASQGPNLIFSWLNIFIQIGGKLTTRIVWSIAIEMVLFVITVVLAMVDSSDWPGIFFGATMFIVVILNMANGIYQNTVYGMAAKLPPNYTGAVVIGSNVSGTFTSIINIIALAMSPNPRTAAIYYFITALFVLAACFDTYFALPLNRFYKYNELMSQKAAQKKLKETEGKSVPYWSVFKQTFPQCFNVFLVFFVTLAIFPAVHSDVAMSDKNFIIPEKYYVATMCFLTFNACAMIGSYLSSYGSWPSPRWLWVPVTLRLAFIPLFLVCNYQPMGVTRTLPVLIDNDWAYFVIAVLMGLSSGYFSSVAMMYCPGMVDPKHAATASMFGAACLITGICTGVVTSIIFPWVVSAF